MITPGETDTDFVRLLERRGEFLRCLESSPRQKPAVVKALGWSRSTVDRALRELEQAGFVERTGQGYVTTLSGQLAIRTYDEFVELVENILVASPLIETLPRDASVPLDSFTGVERVSVADHTSFEIPTVLRSAIESAHRLTVLTSVRTDPLLLGLCQSRVVQDGIDLDLVVGAELHETLQHHYPGTLDELAHHGNRLLRTERSPSYSVFLVEYEEDTTETANEAIAIAYDSDTRTGIFRSDAPVAFDSAQGYIASIMEQATDITIDEVVASERQRRLPVAATWSNRHGKRDERVLEREGFIELTDDYFDSRSPGSPTTSWRTGMNIVEVAAGHAAERTRERDGERRSIVDELLDGLRAGDDHALVGLPGSGKSTVCKTVAYRWYKAGHGTVLYREDGERAFESTAALRSRLRDCDGHTLVILEDALTEANAIFRVISEFRTYPTVTFLVESREHAWDDPSVGTELDTHHETYRTETIERVRMPALDVTECERLIHHFETVTGQRVDLDASDLLDRHEHGHGQEHGRDNDPAALLMALHRLALSADPLASFRASSTTLTEDVLRTYDDLRAIGDRALDVGVLVSVLNATDIGVYPEFVYALADENNGHDYEVIEDALALLEGRIIFEQPDSGVRSGSEGVAHQYRSVHESWSVLFLQQLHDGAQAQARARGSDRFGRVVSTLLSLADDACCRVRISWEFAGTASPIKEVSADPQGWADETIERLFSLGLSHSALAPLFDTGVESRIELPEACSSEMAVRCTEWRGKMSLRAGNLDDAAHEFERLADHADDPPAALREEADRLRARSLKYRGTVEFRRSEFDEAESFYKRSRAVSLMAGDEQGRLDAINNLGIVAWSRGNLDEATAHLRRCLGRYREMDCCAAETDARFNLATVLDSKGELETAADHYQTCIDHYRSTGNCRAEADTLNNLGVLERKRADLESAERCLAQALDTYRDVGDRIGEANSLHSLGYVAQLRGDFEQAIEFHEHSLEQYHEVDDNQGVAQCLNELGTIDRRQGNLTAAKQRYEHSHDLRRDIGDHLGVAECLVNLGRIAHLNENLDIATNYAKQSLNRYQERGDVRGKATCLRLLGVIERERCDDDRNDHRFETAADCFSKSLEHTRESGDRLGEARTLAQQGRLAAEQQQFERAQTQYETALSMFHDIGAVPDYHETVAELTDDRRTN